MIGTKKEISWMFKHSEYDCNVINIIVSFDCNLHCKDCFIRYIKNKNTERVISEENIIKFLDYCTPIFDDPIVLIFGGEPMLYPDKVQFICDECRKRGLKSLMYTNCFFGEDEVLLNKLAREIRPTYIGLSFDNMHLIDSTVRSKVFHYLKNDDIESKIFFATILQYKRKFKNEKWPVFCAPLDGKMSPDCCYPMGLAIQPDGKIIYDCPMWAQNMMCYCGDINNLVDSKDLCFKKKSTCKYCKKKYLPIIKQIRGSLLRLDYWLYYKSIIK
jgi:MoaA/NifB/PqqE/SkfB family radical SAM enzyme